MDSWIKEFAYNNPITTFIATLLVIDYIAIRALRETRDAYLETRPLIKGTVTASHLGTSYEQIVYVESPDKRQYELRLESGAVKGVKGNVKEQYFMSYDSLPNHFTKRIPSGSRIAARVHQKDGEERSVARLVELYVPENRL